MFYPKYENKKMEFINTQSSYKAKYRPMVRAAGTTEEEIKKYYTFNQTGNVMVSSTVQEEKDLQPAVREVFQKSATFLGIVSAALYRAGRNLYDYEALHDIIGGSGNFVPMHMEDRTFSYSSKEFTLNTAIISAALGSVNAMGGAMKIAQKVIESMGSQLRIESSKTESTKKVAHLLIVCENLMGMPLVNIALFYVDSKEAQTVAKTNCSSYVTTTVNFNYHQEDWMFVDPEYIKKYENEFTKNPEQEKLIEQFAALIKTPEAGK